MLSELNIFPSPTSLFQEFNLPESWKWALIIHTEYSEHRIKGCHIYEHRLSANNKYKQWFDWFLVTWRLLRNLRSLESIIAHQCNQIFEEFQQLLLPNLVTWKLSEKLVFTGICSQKNEGMCGLLGVVWVCSSTLFPVVLYCLWFKKKRRKTQTLQKNLAAYCFQAQQAQTCKICNYQCQLS